MHKTCKYAGTYILKCARRNFGYRNLKNENVCKKKIDTNISGGDALKIKKYAKNEMKPKNIRSALCEKHILMTR